MTEPIRVLHFADVHIGMDTFGRINPETGLNTRVHDFLARMDDMLTYARDHEADLIVFAGDAFRNARPDPTYQRAFARRIKQMAEIAPTILLVGNHDVQPNSSKASSIDIYNTLDVPNVMVAETFDVHEVMTRRGRVIVGTAPYPVRARVLEDGRSQARTLREIDAELHEALYQALANLAERADELAGDDPRLLTGHFTISGAKFGSERGVMLGNDVALSLGVVADANWDYVAMGHIHRFQNLTEGRAGVPPVVYSGSVERVDFGEENDEKGFCWIELAREATTWRFVPLPSRPMVTLKADCRTDTKPTETVIQLIKQHHNLQHAIVRLRIDLRTDSNALLREDRVREALREAGVFHIASIEHRLERSERTRLGTSPEGLTQDQLLERYLLSKGLPASDAQVLMALAAPLMAES